MTDETNPLILSQRLVERADEYAASRLYLYSSADALFDRSAASVLDSLAGALRPIAAIWPAYLANDLDDGARRFWGRDGAEQENTTDPKDVQLYSGRGGKELLTLADAKRAFDALAGGTVKVSECAKCRSLDPTGVFLCHDHAKPFANFDCSGKYRASPAVPEVQPISLASPEIAALRPADIAFEPEGRRVPRYERVPASENPEAPYVTDVGRINDAEGDLPARLRAFLRAFPACYLKKPLFVDVRLIEAAAKAIEAIAQPDPKFPHVRLLPGQTFQVDVSVIPLFVTAVEGPETKAETVPPSDELGGLSIEKLDAFIRTLSDANRNMISTPELRSLIFYAREALVARNRSKHIEKTLDRFSGWSTDAAPEISVDTIRERRRARPLRDAAMEIVEQLSRGGTPSDAAIVALHSAVVAWDVGVPPKDENPPSSSASARPSSSTTASPARSR